MLARRLTTILPAMTLAEAIETTRFHSVASLTGDRTALIMACPFRTPHHTISDVGLIGGGHVPVPGEVSLAHHGVLFLDELPEFRRHVLEVLRQPLENGVKSIPFLGASLIFLCRPRSLPRQGACIPQHVVRVEAGAAQDVPFDDRSQPVTPLPPAPLSRLLHSAAGGRDRGRATAVVHREVRLSPVVLCALAKASFGVPFPPAGRAGAGLSHRQSPDGVQPLAAGLVHRPSIMRW